MIEFKLGDRLDVMRNMADKSVDVLFTSPPYNRKRNDKYSMYDDSVNDYLGFIQDTIDEGLRVTKRHIILNLQSNYYNREDVYRIIGQYSKIIQNIIIWEKSNPLPASGYNITNSYEMFLIIGNTPLRSNTTYTKNHITTSVNSTTTTKIHKAVMKQEVSDWFISQFTKENETILDCFMGLGTTGISCAKFNRNFIGIEINEHYLSISKERISEFIQIEKGATN